MSMWGSSDWVVFFQGITQMGGNSSLPERTRRRRSSVRRLQLGTTVTLTSPMERWSSALTCCSSTSTGEVWMLVTIVRTELYSFSQYQSWPHTTLQQHVMVQQGLTSVNIKLSKWYYSFPLIIVKDCSICGFVSFNTVNVFFGFVFSAFSVVRSRTFFVLLP